MRLQGLVRAHDKKISPVVPGVRHATVSEEDEVTPARDVRLGPRRRRRRRETSRSHGLHVQASAVAVVEGHQRRVSERTRSRQEPESPVGPESRQQHPEGAKRQAAENAVETVAPPPRLPPAYGGRTSGAVAEGLLDGAGRTWGRRLGRHVPASRVGRQRGGGGCGLGREGEVRVGERSVGVNVVRKEVRLRGSEKTGRV